MSENVVSVLQPAPVFARLPAVASAKVGLLTAFPSYQSSITSNTEGTYVF